MRNEFEADLVTLTNENGEKLEFKIFDKIENNNGSFYVLSPVFENPSDELNRAFEFYIFEVINENGEEQLVEVEDKEKAQKLYDIFEERYNEMLFGE